MLEALVICLMGRVKANQGREDSWSLDLGFPVNSELVYQSLVKGRVSYTSNI